MENKSNTLGMEEDKNNNSAMTSFMEEKDGLMK